ncbi:TonB-dependent receptor [Mucilaginibacter terrenus]|uniref:TonB-dependent receptor n=1 Tax=Mucilaginibacter terrenus TaxID=2482727 RepID=A0A3E2NUQ9_9SPHI|nr:TonB-dependent receptor [Mucilaginibacter terrenus]RFZ84743.1 TonB-dependent receptor [Mucilaginibacter terrenus]
MNKVLLKLSLPTVLITSLLCAESKAQDSTRSINEVVVTATRSAKKLSETGRVVTVISAQEIARAQGRSLPQLLNTVPGITFSGAQNAPGLATSVFLRGASTGNTLILIDGFPANNAGSIDGSYDLNAFPVDQIERIEILKGSGSTMYGSDAVAGVINIITKHAKTAGLKGNLQASGGSYNTFRQSAGLNGKLNKTGLAINLSNNDSKGFPAAVDTLGTGTFRKTGFHQRSASVNVDQELSRKFILNGNLQVSRNTGNLPNGTFTNDENYDYRNTFLFGGLGATVLLPKGALKLKVTQNTVKNNFENLGPDNDSTHQVTRNIGRITNAEAVFNYDLGRYFDITSGGGYKYTNSSQYSLFEQAFYHPEPSVIPAGAANNSISSVYTSLFFKSDIFHMEVGGRYNHHSTAGNKFTYTINPSVLLADQLKIFGNLSSAFKAPSLYQLTSQYGNLELKPEYTKSYEAGFDWEIVSNTLSFNTAFFKRNTSNVIYFFTDPKTFASNYENGSFQKDKGFETELKYNSKVLTATAWYAYVTGKLTDANGLQTNNLYRRPKNTFGANVALQATKQVSVGVTYKYTGERRDTYFNPVSFKTDIINLKHYNLVDLHLGWAATSKLSLFGDVNNLLDVKYTDWVGYNTMCANFTVGANYQFK